IRPGYHMNKRHWISVDFSGDVSDQLQEHLIYHSYCQTAMKLPKKILTQLNITELLDPEWKDNRSNRYG
ncbi:MAG: MmcQ/YjbR family DNA-binding protein, partial [Muribaculaceae bacterium]|nr:MmcQ/YjbR family DNA-binding protein [Muribaculaceae bacterium]